MLNRFNDDHGNGFAPRLWNAKGGAIALALTAMLLPACTNNDQPVAGGPGPQSNVTTEEVADETAELIGKPVTVRDEVEEKVGPNAFTIKDEELFGGDEVLVVNASGAPLVLPEDEADVQVTGEVAKFVVAELNREYDFLELEPEVYVEYEGKPAIIAQAIAPAPEPGEITENPKQYYGRTLAVAGEVENIIGPNAFTLDEEQLIGANDLLVLVTNPKTTVDDGQYVAVTGVLRPFVVADIEREYDLTWDLDLQRKLEAEYSTKPVLVVDAIYPSAVPPAAK
jgi:hypothetical protein